MKKGRDRMVSLFLAPATEEGRTTLRHGDNMWMYIPDVGRPLRITSLQSVVGGIFNNSDLMRLEYSVEYAAEGVEETPEGYVLDLKAKTDAVAYDRLKMWVDKEVLLPTKIEAYAVSGLLIKTLRGHRGLRRRYRPSIEAADRQPPAPGIQGGDVVREDPTAGLPRRGVHAEPHASHRGAAIDGPPGAHAPRPSAWRLNRPVLPSARSDVEPTPLTAIA